MVSLDFNTLGSEIDFYEYIEKILSIDDNDYNDGIKSNLANADKAKTAVTKIFIYSL